MELHSLGQQAWEHCLPACLPLNSFHPFLWLLNTPFEVWCILHAQKAFLELEGCLFNWIYLTDVIQWDNQNTQLTDVYAMCIHILGTRDIVWKTKWAAHWSWAQSGCRFTLFKLIICFETTVNLGKLPGHWLNELMPLETHHCWKKHPLPSFALLYP